MRLFYYPETDSLYIELSERASADSVETAPGVVIDLDEQGDIVGIDIDRASERLSLDRLELKDLPFRSLVAQQTLP
ncbi:MAG: DUF2283 domain-containing protein [Fimbriimonadales bacterium]|nr:DUF2283 domain-containing protein [Fimbriimonadales bacterium]